MSTNVHRPSPAARIVNALVTLFVLGFLAVMLFLMWPMIMERFAAGPLAIPQALPTAAVRVPPIPAPRPQEVAPVVAPPIDGIAQNEATAQAMYDAAIRAGEQHVDLTGDTAPVIHGQRTNDREPAGENVPTAEPVQVVTDWFGNKQKPINIQETHTCLHGQVWHDGGCHNP